MPEEVVNFIIQYGYMAIFILVFLQEIGMPNPIPNELVLMFSGYLSFKGILYLPFVLLTVISADFIGTNILYVIFYNAGAYIMLKKPKWFLSDRMIDKLKRKVAEGGKSTIFIFRVTPFTRGYTSVIAGLLHVKPRIFLPVAFISALAWASIYVVIGYVIGPSWNVFIRYSGNFKYIMLSMLAIVVIVVLLVNRKRRKHKAKAAVS